VLAFAPFGSVSVRPQNASLSLSRCTRLLTVRAHVVLHVEQRDDALQAEVERAHGLLFVHPPQRHRAGPVGQLRKGRVAQGVVRRVREPRREPAAVLLVVAGCAQPALAVLRLALALFLVAAASARFAKALEFGVVVVFG
jgi:hypothetical protein